MNKPRTDWVIENLMKVYKEMSLTERQLFQFAVVGLNEQFNNWNKMSKEEQDITREGLKGIIELSLEGELL